MADRVLLKSYVPSEMRKRIRQYAAKKGVSESSVANAALIRYLDDTNDIPLILRQLHRMSRQLKRVGRESDTLSEAFALFVQIWFAHTPRLAVEEMAAAEQSALQRFSEYVERIAERIASGASVAGLPQRNEDLGADE